MSNHIQQFDWNVNLLRSVLWQYEGAPKNLGLATKDNLWFADNHTRFWEDWYKNVFVLDTANLFGLAVWARILNGNISVVQEEDAVSSWGFGTFNKDFEQAGFFQTAAGITLSVEAARKYLKMRWLIITENLTIPNINKMLNVVFGEGLVFVTDNEDMTIGYTFAYEPEQSIRDLINTTDFLPRPAGVKIIDWVVIPREHWGFTSERKAFEKGSFHFDRVSNFNDSK